MKVIKPLDLGLLYRTYELNQRYYLVSTIIAFFSFDDPEKLKMELKMWPMVAEELGTEGVLDTGMPKMGSEFLVCGNFFPPNDQPAHAGSVEVQIGNQRKELNVFGDRHWIKGIGGQWKLSDPEMLPQLSLNYQYSFGGPDYPENPLGKGYVKDLAQYKSNVIAVPNITLPDQPISIPDQKMLPAGFGPYDQTWPQRFSKIGTYDEKWLNERFPGFAEDFDPAFLNTAPLDQQQREKFTCLESFSCKNMHPEKSSINSRLPGIRTRCFINNGENKEIDLHEIKMQADTVWLFPHKECGVVLFRGQIEVSDDQASEFSQIVVAYEKLTDDSRPLSHYKEALSSRLDKKKGYLQSLNEKDLIPDGAQSAMSQLLKEGESASGDGILEKNIQKKSDSEIEAAWESIKDYGLNPDDYKKKNEDFSVDIDMDNLDQLDDLVEKIELEAKKQEKELEDSLRNVFSSMGNDYDEFLADAETKKGERVSFSAEEMISLMRDSGIDDPKKEARLHKIEKEFDSLSIQYGHFFDPVPAPSQESMDEMRKKVIQAVKEGKSLTKRELPGVDLSGLDLTGIDLSESFLDGAKLQGTILTNANLSKTMLARANLSDARLNNANLTETNLGKANLNKADFSDCQLKKAVFYQADLTEASFVHAQMEAVDFTECIAEDTHFSSATLDNAMFFESKLNGADFSDSSLNEAFFYNTSVQKANFSNAKLMEAVLVQVNANGSDFKNANMENLRTAMKTSMENSDFTQANLKNANLRETSLKHSNFTKADLSAADLSKSKLNQSTFYQAVAKQTMFMQADLSQARLVSINLMEGSLQKAIMQDCDLRGANLFCADLMQVDFSTVLLDQANVEKTILSKWSSS